MNRQIFLDAAELIETGVTKYSCLAIDIVIGNPRSEYTAEAQAYSALFGTEIEEDLGSLPMSRLLFAINRETRAGLDSQHLRVMLLLFAAEVFSD